MAFSRDFPALGGDPAMKSLNQWKRPPNTKREGGETQSLLYLKH